MMSDRENGPPPDVCGAPTMPGEGSDTNNPRTQKFTGSQRRKRNTAPPRITVRGQGRCVACSFHIGAQGHREGCDGTSGAEAAERYRRGLCIDCGATRYAAGRPRCNACRAGREGRSP
jgi:hypothetical protein